MEGRDVLVSVMFTLDPEMCIICIYSFDKGNLGPWLVEQHTVAILSGHCYLSLARSLSVSPPTDTLLTLVSTKSLVSIKPSSSI